MTEQHSGAAYEGLIRRLATETGISEAQARELVLMLGVDWSSLVREARVLRSPVSQFNNRRV